MIAKCSDFDTLVNQKRSSGVEWQWVLVWSTANDDFRGVGRRELRPPFSPYFREEFTTWN
jgi:hypothetical protein